MSSEALPISPTRFAAALTDLPLSTLHLKVLELRNSIAHLDYSNEQLRPFAEGTATATATSTSTTTTAPPQQAPSSTTATAEPDADCADAIRENEGVIARMQERIALVRAEVERRGLGWAEFSERGGAGGREGEAGGCEWWGYRRGGGGGGGGLTVVVVWGGL
ncbi:hypothetical protein CHGG_00824 [Chaetomium globosum CBS 148.51]|uniref:Uncharacterized protein n=1 Tax=Chaetomium globosum (strain ATCC 6205 / CBS 148.51 / DSM 1962 / NBRC 6347 / NRRL 1970) TaxID=306901 RepID=Q2HG30_CHAGB|nr:uncharacterized protein CHGG_00824 [Chaetomium globosum CBS 148.51]EAQ92589.1 hypothetical protein CHGG_00824 [Chaetomium globosum CBS 148.51]